MDLLQTVLCLIIGYVFGIFQTAFIYGKYLGIDIRKVGSGNAGTTNALRNLGVKAGAIVFFGDVMKCAVAVILTRLLFAGGDPAVAKLVTVYTGLGCVLGHNFPFYMNFKGGKGVACSYAVATLLWWPFGLIGAGIFFLIFFTVHYVSLGSLVGLTVVYGLTGILAWSGYFGLTVSQNIQMAVVAVILIIMVFWQHHENISRLKNHCERKTYFTKKGD